MMNLKQQLAVRLADSPLWQRWQRLAPRERTSLSLPLHNPTANPASDKERT